MTRRVTTVWRSLLGWAASAGPGSPLEPIAKTQVPPLLNDFRHLGI